MTILLYAEFVIKAVVSFTGRFVSNPFSDQTGVALVCKYF